MKHKIKRALSAALACVMVLALLPATALAANTSTIKFTIVNGYWKSLTTDDDATFSDPVYDTDGTTLLGYSTVVIRTTQYGSSGYVYKCGGYMEQLMFAIAGGNTSEFIQPVTGYEFDTQFVWAVTEGLNGGGSANAQISAIADDPHDYDNNKPPIDTFKANTVYTLTLIKSSYPVTGTIDHGTVDKGSQSIKYQEPSGAMTFTPAAGYQITGVKVNGAEESFTLNSDGTYTYPAQTVTNDISVAVTTTPITYTISYELNGGALAAGKTNPGSYTVTSPLITLNNPTKTGYIFAGWTGTGLSGASTTVTIPTGSTGDRSYTATWTPNPNTPYKVEHYKQNLDGTYPAAASETDNKSGTTGEQTAATANTYEGFTAQTFEQKTIAGDGTTVVKIYYTRDSYTVTYNYGTAPAGASALPTGGTYKYDETVTVAAAATAPGYTFNGWTTTDATVSDGAFTMPAKNVTLSGSWTVNQYDYTVEYYYDNMTGAAPTGAPEGDKADFGTDVTINPADSVSVGGNTYTLTSTNHTVTIGTGSNVIKVYYEKDNWKDSPSGDSKTGGDGIPDSQQALIEYLSADSTKGSVSPTVQVETLTKTGTSYTGTVNLNSTATPAAGQKVAFDYWEDLSEVKTYTAALSGRLTVSGGQTYTYTAYFDTDNNGDGIPDKYQVFVNFESADPSKGTVTERANAVANTGIHQVYTLRDPSGNPVTTGTVTPKLDGVVVKANPGFAFDIWTKDTNGTAAVNPTVALPVNGNTTITFKAHFDTDKIGGANGGDGIPDKYQATVTYQIVNGTWDGTNKADRVEVFTLYAKDTTTGDWAAVSPAPTLNGTIPTGMKANDEYSKSEGYWGTKDDTTDDPMDATVVDKNLTYVYTFGTRNTWTITVTVENGSSDVTSPVTVNHGANQTITFTANENYVLDGVTVNGKTASLNDDGSYAFTNVKDDQNIKVVYAYDGKGKLDEEGKETGDGIPDKYQVFVKYEAGANGSLTGDTYKVYDLRQDNATALKNSVTLTFPTPKANIGYQFSGWTNPAGVTVEDSVMSGFTAGETYTFTASFTGIYDPPVVIPDPTIKVKGLNTVDHVTYIIGVGNDKVNPMGTITRGEIAAIYFRLMTDEFRSANWSTVNRFKDVPDNAWYTMAILTLDKAGIITDSDDGNFRPNEPITRAELAVMAAQFCTVTGNIPKTSFKDVPANHWAAKEIALIEYAGWIEGYAGCFRPDDNLTRAEAVTIVNRMLQRGAEAENMLPDMVTFVDNTPDMWYYEAIQEAANCHDYTRTTKLLTGETFRGEKWTALLEATDWAALEKAWIEANS